MDTVTHLLNDNNRLSAKQPERVLQFGDGNFLRGYIDWMFHRLNEAGQFNGSVVVVRPRGNGDVSKLNEQDGLYTLLLRGVEGGEVVSRSELISSLSRGINPFEDFGAFLKTARDLNMRYVVSNATESGVEYVRTPFEDGVCPISFPAKLTRWLGERFKAFNGSRESGVVVLPCELIEDNGSILKDCVLKHAGDFELGDAFEKWLQNECVFLTTLVDRIVPGYPKEEAENLQKELGYEDRMICAGEVYHQLVIEGPLELKAELPFESVGLNVIWCDDIQPYRMRKVGILNGAHTTSVLAAYLSGVDTVLEMMNDVDLSSYLNKLIFEEIVPVLPTEKAETEAFATAVLERFSNPFIRHELLSISLNSVSKWRVRVLPSVKAYFEKYGEAPPLLSFSLAALIAFYKGDIRDGYTLKDDEQVLGFFRKAWDRNDAEATTSRILQNTDFWGEDLAKLPGFEKRVAEYLQSILNKGVKPTILDLLK